MRFGRWDFRAFLDEITADELNGWLDFAEQDPAGWLSEWGPTAAMMSWMAATHPFSPVDIPAEKFLPRYGPPPPAETDGERAAKVKASGGVVRQPPPLVKYTPKG